MSSQGRRPGEPMAAEESGLRVESRVRVLLVADRVEVTGEIGEQLRKAVRGDFEVVLERDLARAAALCRGQAVDLLLLDLALAGVRRRALVDWASELATRLPIVLLSGTESLGAAPEPARRALRAELEEADLPSVLVRTLHRAQRLGTLALPPVFVRLEYPDA